MSHLKCSMRCEDLCFHVVCLQCSQDDLVLHIKVASCLADAWNFRGSMARPDGILVVPGIHVHIIYNTFFSHLIIDDPHISTMW